MKFERSVRNILTNIREREIYSQFMFNIDTFESPTSI